MQAPSKMADGVAHALQPAGACLSTGGKMLDAKDEIIYRRTQRQLGEVQVALSLMVGVMKQAPWVPGLEVACSEAHKAKGAIMSKIFQMEGGR